MTVYEDKLNVYSQHDLNACMESRESRASQMVDRVRVRDLTLSLTRLQMSNMKRSNGDVLLGYAIVTHRQK
jgi:hypothetical protein